MNKNKKCLLTIGNKNSQSECSVSCYAYKPGSGCAYLKSIKLFFESRNAETSQLSEQKDIEDIIIENYQRLKSYCYQLTQNLHISDDVCQEVLRKALENKDNFAPDQPILPWLLRTAKNLVIDMYRKEKYQNTQLIDDFTAYSFEEKAADELPLDIVSLFAMASLTENQRKAIELVYVEDLGIEEAARVMGLSYKGFYSLLKRALQKLSKEMKEIL